MKKTKGEVETKLEEKMETKLLSNNAQHSEIKLTSKISSWYPFNDLSVLSTSGRSRLKSEIEKQFRDCH